MSCMLCNFSSISQCNLVMCVCVHFWKYSLEIFGTGLSANFTGIQQSGKLKRIKFKIWVYTWFK